MPLLPSSVRLPASVILGALVLGSAMAFSTGLDPGHGGISANIARTAPACGRCHNPTPGHSGLRVTTTPSLRSLDAGQSISVNTRATGGPVAPGNEGGFVSEATAGTFASGAGSRLGFNSAGKFITHSDPNGNRNWTYIYTAPAQPGPVELYTVVNAVDGNGVPNLNDAWSFHGFDGTSTLSTPIRMFVNATGASSFGAGCADGFGNYPVLGTARSPAVGDQGFAFDIVGAAPAANGIVALGFRFPSPIDLATIGAPTCSLLVNSFTSVAFATTAGDAQRAEGRAIAALPIVNDPNLRGRRIDAQAVIVDVLNRRPLPITLTNGLGLTLQ